MIRAELLVQNGVKRLGSQKPINCINLIEAHKTSVNPRQRHNRVMGSHAMGEEISCNVYEATEGPFVDGLVLATAEVNTPVLDSHPRLVRHRRVEVSCNNTHNPWPNFHRISYFLENFFSSTYIKHWIEVQIDPIHHIVLVDASDDHCSSWYQLLSLNVIELAHELLADAEKDTSSISPINNREEVHVRDDLLVERFHVVPSSMHLLEHDNTVFGA